MNKNEKKVFDNKFKNIKKKNENEYGFVVNTFEWTTTDEQTKKAFEIDKKLNKSKK